MASLEDAVSALEGLENGSELTKAVLEAVDGERAKGQDALRKVNSEAKGLRERAKAAEGVVEAFKSLGYDPEGDTPDPHEFADGFLQVVEKAKQGKLPDGYDIKNHPDYKRVARELAKISEEHKLTQSERDKLRKDRAHDRIRSTLSKALRDDKGEEMLFASDKVVNELLLTDRVRLTDGDELVFVDGESEIDFDSGLKKVLDENKNLLKNQNRPGGGSGGVETDPMKQSQAERTAHLRKLRRGDY